MQRTFDRRPYFDSRSLNFRITDVITKEPRAYTWYCPVRLDQGNEGACVGFAWAQELASRPKMHTLVTKTHAQDIYHKAQLIDAWPETPPEEGTSVIAGAKIAKQSGYLGEYRWCFSVDDLKVAVSWAGPVVLGIYWFNDMLDPDRDGYVHPTGGIAGGHAILTTGYSPTLKRFRLVNSWGRSWGV